MTQWIHTRARGIFHKIAEPRIIRLTLFGVYVCMIIAGMAILNNPPVIVQHILGNTLVTIFGAFVSFGGLFGSIAVLPGVWWLERVGIIFLVTGMGLYILALITIGASFFIIIISVAFALSFAVRWQEIRRFQLAPLSPKER